MYEFSHIDESTGMAAYTDRIPASATIIPAREPQPTDACDALANFSLQGA